MKPVRYIVKDKDEIIASYNTELDHIVGIEAEKLAKWCAKRYGGAIFVDHGDGQLVAYDATDKK